MKLIYVAGPYSKPKPIINVVQNLQIQMQLMDLGYVATSGVNWHEAYRMEEAPTSPEVYEKWLTRAIKLMSRCDAVLRLPGESSGADKEVEAAEHWGIPVFYTVEELVEKVKA